MFCVLIYATIFSIKIIKQKHVATIESYIVCCQYVKLKHVATIGSHIVRCQYADLSRWVNYKNNSSMNPTVKENIITEIFKKISKEIFLCKRCFDNEIYCGVSNEQEMLIHVYHHHRGFWNVSMHLSSSLTQLAWSKLFNLDVESSIIKCRHCNMVFDINGRVALLYNHIRMEHEIIISALSLSNL